MPVLTAIDVIGIQSYIFASNRLSDVVGASYLVEWATSNEVGKGLDVEGAPMRDVLLAAGGNSILRFETKDDARRYALRYTRRLLDEAPGLDVAISHRKYAQGQLAKGILGLQVELAKAKLNRRPHAPQLGLGVMQPCAVTGLPATEESKEFGKQWVSPRFGKIRSHATRRGAKARWQEFLADEPNGRDYSAAPAFLFPDELDRMGRTRDDTSLVGVVHVDGNGIGKRIQRWLVARQQADDGQIHDEYRKWSEALMGLGGAVFREVLKRLIARIEPADGESGIYLVQGQPSPPRQLDFGLESENGSVLLPFRPILLGGDDLTFVCDGRLALDLATTAIRAFGEESRRLGDLRILGTEPITACAGVALVKAHAPFSRSYELCERLCASAKQAKRAAEAIGPGSDTGGWLDWHIGPVRPDESLDDIRQRQYEGEKLTCRPYPLAGAQAERLTWEWLDTHLLGEPASGAQSTDSFRNPYVWGERRNKVKSLPKLLRQGGDAIKSQIAAWRSIEPDIGLPAPLDPNGFKGKGTPLLDAVELLDIHLRLEPPTPSGTSNDANKAGADKLDSRQ